MQFVLLCLTFTKRKATTALNTVYIHIYIYITTIDLDGVFFQRANVRCFSLNMRVHFLEDVCTNVLLVLSFPAPIQP